MTLCIAMTHPASSIPYLGMYLTYFSFIEEGTQARIEALLETAGKLCNIFELRFSHVTFFFFYISFLGIGKLTGGDNKRLGDQEVLMSSVSCALDKAAAALTRMCSVNSSNFHQEAR